MFMEISSTTLFHFTRKYEYLKDILKNGFWPRYCIEPDWNGKDLAIPMVCFCDIPLSQALKHIASYGNYGIGVTKQFAKENNITPVFYVGTNRNTKTSSLYKLLNHFIENGPSTDESSISFEEKLLYYIKRVEGCDNNKKKIKFYNEREWRYVPTINEDIHIEILQKNMEKKKQEAEIKQLCKKTKNNRIKFKPQDIKYIFVRGENNVKKILRDIDDIFKSNTLEERNLLKTKIIYTQQIKEDF